MCSILCWASQLLLVFFLYSLISVSFRCWCSLSLSLSMSMSVQPKLKYCHIDLRTYTNVYLCPYNIYICNVYVCVFVFVLVLRPVIFVLHFFMLFVFALVLSLRDKRIVCVHFVPPGPWPWSLALALSHPTAAYYEYRSGKY